MTTFCQHELILQELIESLILLIYQQAYDREDHEGNDEQSLQLCVQYQWLLFIHDPRIHTLFLININ